MPSETVKLDSTSQISKLFRAKGGEEFFVYGVVIEPEQGIGVGGKPLELISVEETRSAAHKYMRQSQEFTDDHYSWVSSQVRILESYLAPVDFELEGETIKRGSWIMGLKILDTDLWGYIKSEEVVGFSIGGEARVVEEEI